MPSTSSKAAVSTVGGIIAAIGSTLCCAGPLVAVLIGVSGAGLSRMFEPLRPVFVVGTVAALGYAHWTVRRADVRACEPEAVCASPTVRAWTKWTLWIGTALAVPLLLFPWWSRFVLG
jgi:mercuric ion transport protein